VAIFNYIDPAVALLVSAAVFGERMTPLILRDSFAVHILQNGGDLKTLQELMGFEDMSVGIAYLSVTDIHVKDVFNRTHPRA
jgi:integrase/recombinase XerD